LDCHTQQVSGIQEKRNVSDEALASGDQLRELFLNIDHQQAGVGSRHLSGMGHDFGYPRKPTPFILG
jgi:hypothetical protein